MPSDKGPSNFVNRGIPFLLWGMGFFLYSFLALSSPASYSSPDERANAFFAKRFATESRLSYPLPLSRPGADIVRPRSTLNAEGALLPLSFLGMPLTYGMLAKVTRIPNIDILTPILSAFGVVAFYLLLRRLFPFSLALGSAVLLLVHPAYWYVSNRGMFHNAPFVALVLIAAFFAVRAVTNKRIPDFFFAGASLGLAVSFRVVEGLWLGPLVLCIFFLWRRTLWSRRLLISIAGGVLFFLPTLIANHLLFGSPFNFGYTINAGTLPAEETVISSVSGSSFLFPFGLRIQQSLERFWFYGGEIFPWLAPFWIIGVVAVLWDHLRRKTTAITKKLGYWLFIFCLAALWLVPYYGSWRFSEFHFNEAYRLGSSYMRYWLPLFVLSIPFTAYGIWWVCSRAFPLRRTFIYTACIVLSISMATNMVFSDKWHGLLAEKASLESAKRMVADLDSSVPMDAIIISGNADKMIFPKRLVVLSVDYANLKDRIALADLARQVPIFWLANDLNALGDATLLKAEEYGFAFREYQRIGKTERLFELVSYPKNIQ